MHRRAFLKNRLPRDTTCNTEGTFDWMPNNKGIDPCELIDQVLQVCNPDFQLGTLSRHLSCGAGNCCCSIESYALLSACRVCQGNTASSIGRSYESFFVHSHCQDQSVNLTVQPEMEQLNIPEWAMLPPDNLTTHWDITKAEAFVKSSLASSASTTVLPSPAPTMPPQSPVVQTRTADSNNSASSSPSADVNTSSSTSGATIAAAVLGSLAGLAVTAMLGWFLWRWRRRRRLRPKVGPRVDLTDPGLEPKQTTQTFDLLGGESDRPPRSPTFPFPFEWFFRRYHPDAPHSIEPRSEYADIAPVASQHVRTGNPIPQISIPFPAAMSRRPMDQLEQDLANLQGTGIRDNSPSGKTRPKKKRLNLSISRRDGSNSHSSGSPTNSDGRQSRHHSRKSKGKYHHLPPSAQYLADVARYPQNLDPERPWVKPKDKPKRNPEHIGPVDP